MSKYMRIFSMLLFVLLFLVIGNLGEGLSNPIQKSGNCKYHLSPKPKSAKDITHVQLNDGDVFSISVRRFDCDIRTNVTFVQYGRDGETELGRKSFALSPQTDEVVEFSLGELMPDNNQQEIRVDTGDLEVYKYKLNIRFAPIIEQFGKSPYTGNNPFQYALVVLWSRLKELLFGTSMNDGVGWDIGERADLTVRVRSNPVASVHWQIGEDRVPTGQTVEKYTANHPKRLDSDHHEY